MKAIKTILFVMLLTVPSFSSNAQFQRVYYNSIGEALELTGKIAVYKAAKDGGSPFYYSDTLAVCSVVEICDGFIELNSIGHSWILSDIVIATESGPSSDSTIICFHIPNTTEPFLIEITHDFDKNTIVYNEDSTCMTLKHRLGDWEIESIVLYPSSNHYRYYYSTAFNYADVSLGNNVPDYLSLSDSISRLDITIRGLDDGFFDRCFIKGEYARIKNNSIIWRGEEFKLKRNRFR